MASNDNSDDLQCIVGAEPIFRSIQMTNRASVSNRRIGDNESPKDDVVYPKPKKSWDSVMIHPGLFEAGDINGWSNPIVTHLPMFYPLSANNHVRVSSGSLSTVLSSVRECFRTLSLQCTFSDSPLSATCWSMDPVSVELIVHVWESTENPNQLIVEVQRVAGDSILGSRYIRKILVAAKETNPDGPRQPIPSSTSVHRGIRAVECRTSNMRGADSAAFDESWEIVRALLLADRYDARLLGLESVGFMTESSKSGEKTALRTAQLVLASDARVRDTMISLAFKGFWPSDQKEYQQMQQHSYLALTIVMQAISALHGKQLPTVPDFVRLVDSCLGCHGGMIHQLRDMVAMAHNAPHTAHLASMLLAILCGSKSGYLPVMVRETVPVDVVAQAQRVGIHCHAALETASSKLLIALQA